MLTLPNMMCWTNSGLFFNLNLLCYSCLSSLNLYQRLFLYLQCSFTGLYYALLSSNLYLLVRSGQTQLSKDEKTVMKTD